MASPIFIRAPNVYTTPMAYEFSRMSHRRTVGKGEKNMSRVSFYRDAETPFLEAKHCLADDLAYHKHFHEEYSIGLIHQGRTRAWCDGQLLHVDAGRVISFPPQMLHACQPEPELGWQYSMLFIQPEWLKQLEPRELERVHIPYLLADAKNQKCAVLIEHVMTALREHRGPLETETALIDLLQVITGAEPDDLRHAHHSKGDHQYIPRIHEYLNEHFMKRITLEELEQQVGISRFHLIRLFKQWSHLPPHAYQNVLRINFAKVELARARRSLSDIAIEAGFYDQSHFTRMFTRIVGVTPRQYSLSV